MRMRKKKNLIPRMERCGDRLIREPYSMPGKWRELMPHNMLWGNVLSHKSAPPDAFIHTSAVYSLLLFSIIQ